MTRPSDHAMQVETLGRYQLIASLGQGGMANVYLAVAGGPGSFNKLLVVKALRRDVHAAPEFVTMFLDEARLSARFSHPNIVQTYEVGEADGTYFIAMEFLDGQTLRSVQRRVGASLPLEHELYVLAEAARGLHYAHELRDFAGDPLNVVHRDISPQNVVITYDGQVKLLDFGIAKANDAEHLTQVGLIKGKIEYIAPEQAQGDPVDRRADVFALGAMAWEAVTRQRFAGGHEASAVTKLHRRITGGEPDVLAVKPDTPFKLAHLIRRATALDPAQRLPSAGQFAAELQEYLDMTKSRVSASTWREQLAQPFRMERARIAAIIEEQLGRSSTRSGLRQGLPRITRLDTTLSGMSGTFETQPSSVREAAPSAPPPASAPRPGRSRAVWLAGSAAVASAAILSVLAHQQVPAARAVKSSAPTSSAAATPQAAQTLPAPLPKTIALHLEVEPRGAQATLDSAPLSTLPFDANLARDEALHVLEVSKQGYDTARLKLTYQRDQSLRIALQRTAPVLPAPSAPPHSARTGAVSAATSTAPSGPPSDVTSAGAPEPGSAMLSRPRAGAHIDKVNPYLQ